MASTDLTVIENADDAIEALRGNLVVPIQDPAEVQREMMEAIFDTDDPDAILAGNAGTPGEQMVDIPFTLNGVRYLKSKFKDGLPVFAVMDGTSLADERSYAITSSAVRVCAQAAMLWKLDALPCDVVIRRATEPTANGYYPCWLEKA